jgi:hypothetical protein
MTTGSVVIVTDAIGQELSGNTSYVDEKLDAIAQFLSRGNYQCGYAQKGYYVYTSQHFLQVLLPQALIAY